MDSGRGEQLLWVPGMDAQIPEPHCREEGREALWSGPALPSLMHPCHHLPTPTPGLIQAEDPKPPGSRPCSPGPAPPTGHPMPKARGLRVLTPSSPVSFHSHRGSGQPRVYL